MKINEQYIDVWYSIKQTLRKYTPLDGLMFVAVYGYGHSIRKTSKTVGLTSKEVSSKLKLIKRAVRRDLKAAGGRLDLISNLTGVSHAYEIINEKEQTETSDNQG